MPPWSQQMNPFLPGYMPPVLPSPALVPLMEAPQTAHMNTPRYKSKVRELGDFNSEGFKDWYMQLNLYIDDNAPLLFMDSKKVGAAISMICGTKVDPWVMGFTKEHYLSGQWCISWPRFIWELHQKFNDPDLEKKVAVAAEKRMMQARKGTTKWSTCHKSIFSLFPYIRPTMAPSPIR
ncbi:hypothetical protein WOLCODRAFT_149498 [Wolfiporia cocos MD-104 SS10]|uniref:Uncharacterized protein n=1 Tax=Wolfiporia cocos (strain MD-104) TaxID=742152 RepID=A0A2H3J9G4_WOLCO|nr:hypothetical protein WOLCODRAFT_149498 [Wolfiporia cocos MD-104 SS10]